jgi:hypothetical protein
LVDALVAREVTKRTALRSGQPEPSTIAVEAPAEQPGDIVHEKAKASFEVYHFAPDTIAR